jgi:hypothetical protein
MMIRYGSKLLTIGNLKNSPRLAERGLMSWEERPLRRLGRPTTPSSVSTRPPSDNWELICPCLSMRALCSWLACINRPRFHFIGKTWPALKFARLCRLGPPRRKKGRGNWWFFTQLDLDGAHTFTAWLLAWRCKLPRSCMSPPSPLTSAWKGKGIGAASGSVVAQ